MTGLRRLAAGAVLGAQLVTSTACDGSNPEPQQQTSVTSTAAPDCVGAPAQVHLLPGSANNVTASLRLGITGIQLDADPPTAGISVIDGEPAGAEVTVSVGDVVTFDAEDYTVTQICTGSVDLSR